MMYSGAAEDSRSERKSSIPVRVTGALIRSAHGNRLSADCPRYGRAEVRAFCLSGSAMASSRSIMSASACTSAARSNRSAFVAGVNSQLFSERIDLRDLCTAMTPPQALDNRQYKCNRAANSKALNSPHLLQQQLPKILKCRNVRGSESEREEGLACGADQNEPTRARKLMGSDEADR